MGKELNKKNVLSFDFSPFFSLFVSRALSTFFFLIQISNSELEEFYQETKAQQKQSRITMRENEENRTAQKNKFPSMVIHLLSKKDLSASFNLFFQLLNFTYLIFMVEYLFKSIFSVNKRTTTTKNNSCEDIGMKEQKEKAFLPSGNHQELIYTNDILLLYLFAQFKHNSFACVAPNTRISELLPHRIKENRLKLERTTKKHLNQHHYHFHPNNDKTTTTTTTKTYYDKHQV
eukprot:gene12806-8719_t